MTSNWQDELLTEFQGGLVLPDNRPIYQWASDNVNLHSAYSIPGKFSVDRSRYLIEPFNALADPNIRQINVMASPRCAKTLLAEVFMLHTIANNAGTFGWIQSSDEMADKMGDLRMQPLLMSCPPVKVMIPEQTKGIINKKRYTFPHMKIYLSGAKIKGLQSAGYKYIVGDEVWLWKEGFIGEAKSRIGDFLSTYKILLLSQGGQAGDDWSIEFDKSPIYEWGWVCPACKKEQTYHFNKPREDGKYSGITWSKNETTKPNGEYNYEELSKTVKLSCHYCDHSIKDTPLNRRMLNDTGKYICTNTKGNPNSKSFRWNAMANIELPFSTLAIEYLQAKAIKKQEGNDKPMQEFYQKRLAQSFNERDMQVEMKKIMLADYDTTKPWGKVNIMTIDCQDNFEEFWWVIRSWDSNSFSRGIKRGRAPSWEELRKIQQENQIKDQLVLIDCGYQQTMVFQKCCEYSHEAVVNGLKTVVGWTALKGDKYRDFQHSDNTRRLYSPETRGDPASGQGKKGVTCPVYRWASSRSVKDILVHLRDDKTGKWLNNEYDEEYERQMNSEILTRDINKQTGRAEWVYKARPGVANHYFDCEAMQVVGVCILGLLGDTNTKVNKVDKTKELPKV
jgi:hypothetical protein